MKEANTALRELESLFQAYPDESTSNLVTRWADGLRNDYQSKVQASQDMVNWQVSERYYGIAQTELHREANNREIRRTIAEYRIKPGELSEWCRVRNLDVSHIKAVAMGERENYRGYVQAPFRHYSIGKRYEAPPRRDFGDELEEKPVQKKWGLFTGRKQLGVIPEND